MATAPPFAAFVLHALRDRNRDLLPECTSAQLISFSLTTTLARDHTRKTVGLSTGKIKEWHNYVSDGRIHLLDFKVDGAVMGENGSELRLAEPGGVHATAKMAAFLDETPNSDLQDRPYSEKPYWDIKRARIGQTREVPVELIVNGYPVARQVILADGLLREVSFATRVEQSS